jgi:hypothetical protein
MAGRAGSAAGGPPASLIGKSVASASGGAADEDDDDTMTSASRLQQLKKARGARAQVRPFSRPRTRGPARTREAPRPSYSR